MKNLHTHYDNLKVARNAPPEVIRAAYRILSQKFHPDLNPGDPEAARIMAIINSSYDILSDTNKRMAHDHWIAQQELLAAQGINTNTGNEMPQPTRTQRGQKARFNLMGGIAHILRYWLLYGITCCVVYVLITYEPSAPVTGPKPYNPSPAPVREEYVRPASAPNAQPWPTSAGYIKGYKRLHADGLSTVKIDNSLNDSDVFVKLVSLSGAQAYPVRQFFIPSFGSFTLKKVTAGTYDIRYRDLGNGSLSRSESFTLDEIRKSDGIEFSNITMTLFKVHDGNMQTYSLSEEEF